MVEVGTGTSGTRFLSKRYPVTAGLVAGTTSQIGNVEILVAEDSKIPKKDLTGVR